MMTVEQYTRTSPFIALVKEKYSLCSQKSKKNTQHIVIDIAGSGIKYNVGDCVGVFPVHHPELITNTLKALKVTGKELIHDKRSGKGFSLKEFIMRKANITEVSPKLFSEIVKRQTNVEKKERLEEFLLPENKKKLKNILEEYELWDLLEENQEVNFSPQEIVDLLKPLLPRLYSIASSQKEVGNEIHLTVALLKYDSHGHERYGVCTHYLCDLTSLNKREIPIYIQPHKGFTLPNDHTKSIIMIGPGTGIAPYRGFMQERILEKASGRNWLFFGEWTKENEYYYGDYWKNLMGEGKLRLDLAFSRDQEHKIYVQHKMLENGKDLFDWVQNGAIIYVCGDAQKMAKDVELAIHQIVKDHGKMDEEQAKEFVKKLRTEKRYLRDVY